MAAGQHCCPFASQERAERDTGIAPCLDAVAGIAEVLAYAIMVSEDQPTLSTFVEGVSNGVALVRRIRKMISFRCGISGHVRPLDSVAVLLLLKSERKAENMTATFRVSGGARR
jgi:hypothetical protein